MRRVVLVLAVLVAGALLPVVAPGTAGATVQSWVAAQAPVPPGGSTPARTNIDDVSCPSPGWCVAVGSYGTAAGGTASAPLLEVYATGRWVTVSVPLPSGAGTGARATGALDKIVCNAPRSCTMVGRYADAAGRDLALVASLSGATATSAALAQPNGAGTGTHLGASLDALSCPALGTCTAAGYYETATGGTDALVATLTTGVWSPDAPPLPNGADTTTGNANLTAITCPGVGWCVAVGYDESAGGDFLPLSETLSAGRWSPTTMPVPSNATASSTDYVDAVSCSGIAACTAVGDYTYASARSHGLIDTLSGLTWSDAEAPLPAGGNLTLELYDVVCTSSTWCVAVGQYRGTALGTGGVIETLTGHTWSPTTAPLPPGAETGASRTAELYSLSCDDGDCVAVGHYHTTAAGHPIVGLIDTLAAGAWSASNAPEPFDAAGGATQTALPSVVACDGGSCALSGTYKDTAGGTDGLLDTVGMNPAGYYEFASDGGVFTFTVPFLGSMGGKPLNGPIIDAVADPITGGYYEVGTDGGIFAFGAPFDGSMGGRPLNAPVIAMAFDTRTGGYYEVASDGGIFAFTAPFDGSMGGKPLNKRIVGMALDPATGGYWLVAADGGLFAFDAPFEGSMGGKPLVQPIVGMTFDSLTGGYYEVAADGGLFAFTAPFHGSMGGRPLNEPIVGMAFDYGTGGYYEVAADGGLFCFTAPFKGSEGGKALVAPIDSMAIA